jgi:hypothetical protein
MVMAVGVSSVDESADPFLNMRSVKSPDHAYAIAQCYLGEARYRMGASAGQKNRDNKTWAMFFALEALCEAMKWRLYARTLRANR